MIDVIEIINSLGKTADMLVENKLIPEEKFEFAFEGYSRFSVEPETGLTLVFDIISTVLISVQFTLINTVDDTGTYSGDMPAPFLHKMNKAIVRAFMGEPDYSSGPERIPVIGLVGGFDAYTRKLNDQYPNTEIRFLYQTDLRVDALLFEQSVNND
ncbi:hypothetical protein GPY51_13245 [Photorhabdus laumondii subsp. laumondii]|uniref:Photorhabdus luminescens subsp. laumondii TTO1 complete genome segment 15/17 n=2 Tax=Photorhabdus laumondii subsp. laumondii TaxID=141679 RepID=Q7MZV2_PHOLL|nr:MULTISPECIES: DUF6392 family protein [Photorhabdus]AWK43744.1 hypothetical protein A4R40_20685 [Photorhabdus laumondii subsp. laumondii]AXG44419.1 hypothetical protein PluDJC_20610 [Photorhabdus laumondii subsp. laumondii]AXG49053.1 hypothetical protein PluTT01m_21330 [Photorhabdus laumondii subsp. laumondii]KTL60468.1 hypothetical protein AA106_12920 [Photorhabdus laumondii subsp. laumondii]MCC8384991.1 hypothetical protein [Photorhabdus laumondii]